MHTALVFDDKNINLVLVKAQVLKLGEVMKGYPRIGAWGERGPNGEKMAASFVLDRASILERIGDDEDIYTMIVDMFLADVDNNCSALEAAYAAGDAGALHREAHTIKGLLATFSDDAGAAVALQVEQQAKKGVVDGQAEMIAGLQQRLREVAAALRVG